MSCIFILIQAKKGIKNGLMISSQLNMLILLSGVVRPRVRLFNSVILLSLQLDVFKQLVDHVYHGDIKL